MKNIIIILLISVLLAQESEGNCAEMKKLESTCGNYCFTIVKTVLDHTKALQGEVSECKNRTVSESLDKPESLEKIIREKLEVYEKKMDQKLENMQLVIDMAMVKQSGCTINRGDSVEKLQNIDNAIRKLEVTLQRQHFISILKFHSAEQLLGVKLKSLENMFNQKLEKQGRIIEALLQRNSDNDSLKFDSLAISAKGLLEQFKLTTSVRLGSLSNQLERKLDVHDRKIEAKLNALTKANQVKVPALRKPFKKVGSKYYYVEEKEKVNWFVALHKCLEYGGHLANVQNSLEFSELVDSLRTTDTFWIGINDLGTEGIYTSASTGERSKYLKWGTGEPNNFNKEENCVEINYNNNEHKMNDCKCSSTFLFICEAKYDNQG